MDKKDKKKIALSITEDAIRAMLHDVLVPYGKEYAAQKGGVAGASVAEFLDEIAEMLDKHGLDKLDGEVDVK